MLKIFRSFHQLTFFGPSVSWYGHSQIYGPHIDVDMLQAISILRYVGADMLQSMVLLPVR